ncbi:PAS domain S-box protein, partial [Bacillus sp. EB106-08-02-XG196]|uniref:PAS domain S-box protein n=1 Tax=Bacillus sp. EB106-08-02-XG196 TaxID=2737049 RepID=UPI0015C4A83C|nr:PAS domain S-box protein [Bacillus sp. EB106-08-02-XG196]
MAVLNMVKSLSVESESPNFLSIIDHHPDTIYAMDLNGNILSCNNNIEGVLGYTSSEIHGPFHRLIKKGNLNKVMKHFEKAVAGKVQNYSCISIHKDGYKCQHKYVHFRLFKNVQNYSFSFA